MKHICIFSLLYFASVLIFPYRCVLYPPSITMEPIKDAVYQEEEALMLRCVATGSPPPTYYWEKNGVRFNMNINTGRYTRWPNEGTLIFAKPKGDDDSLYQCIAENDRGRALSVKANVRRAEIQEFLKRPTEKITLYAGAYAKLSCSVPISYPVPIVNWKRVKNGISTLLKDSSRYIMDVDGNLYLTGVTMDDNNAQFICTVFNQRMRVTKSDSPYEITVIEGSTATQIELLFRTVQPIKGRVGEKVELRCILSGNPVPTYRWSMKGQTFDITERPNIFIEAGGPILVINPFTILDQGTYTCTGDNKPTQRPIVVDFDVDAVMYPRLTVRLVDTNVPFNGSAQFKCEATGIPTPTITWTVNGKGMNTYLNGRNKKQIGNTIFLTNLEPTDFAVFQCNASNSIGYDYSNGYINILKDKPELIVGPPNTKVAAENTEAVINCQTFSAPKAVITWLKDGFPISGGRYQIQDNGDLIISKLITADNGNYTCIAKNIYGSISASCVLFVRQRTEIMIRPINTWVYSNQEVKFVCTAKTDRLETQNLKIVWYKDNNLIELTESGRINTNLQDNSLIISGAMTTDTGIYTCNATNGLDFDVAYAMLMVQSKPFTPVKITADCSTFIADKIALVTWQAGADNYAPIISYLVEYSTQYDRDAWYEIQRVTNKTGGTGDTVEARVSLKPNIEYQFRLRAINRVGMSEPSDPTISRCYLPPEIPYSNPKELYLYGTTKENLVIQWTPMTYIEHNGPKLGYEITVSCITCINIPKNESNTTYISDWDQNIITYYNFQIGRTTYEMESFRLFKGSIRAKNEKGVSKAPDTVAYGYSGDAIPTIDSNNLVMTVGPIGRGYVTLSWTIPPQKDISLLANGFFRGYRIEWCLASLSAVDCEASFQIQDVILQTQKLPVLFGNKRRKRSIDGLEKNEELLKEQTHKYDTKYSQVIPSNPATPLNFQVLQRRKRAVLNNPTDWNYENNITVKLTMIPGNTPIKIWLRLLNSIYASKRSDPPITITTFEDTPGPVVNFKVSLLSINHVVLQWLPPVETNGVITGYRLGWREIIGLELGYMTTYPDVQNPNQLEFQMSGLKSATKYRILIWALTSQGAGIESFVDIITQPANIAPNAPKFTVTSVIDNTVNVTFAPSDIGVKGSVFFAQYRKSGQYRWDESESQYIRTWIFIGNLANDTPYDIRIVATNGAGMATPSQIGNFHTGGKLDPTRPVNSNAIWIVVVILLLILFALLIVLIFWLREKNMEQISEKPVQPAHMFSQPKIYDSLQQPLVSQSQMSSSILSGPINTNMRSPNNGSVIESEGSQPSQALIDDNDDLPPVSYQRPAIKKNKSKKHRPIREQSDDENEDAII